MGNAYLNLLPDIWLAILDYIPSGTDLCNYCLTCKDFRALGITCFYRHVILAESADFVRPRHRVDGLTRTLLNNQTLAELVKALEVPASHRTGKALLDEESFSMLAAALPNLKLVQIKYPTDVTENLIHVLCKHPNEPQLHLNITLQDPDLPPSPEAMPSVTSLQASVYPHAWERVRDPKDRRNSKKRTKAVPNQQIVRLQYFLAACPNLNSFRLTCQRQYGGYPDIPPVPKPAPFTRFKLSGKEKFPPLEDLALNGYTPEEDEWDHWVNGVDWVRVRSLALGPQDTVDFLNRATGVVGWLRSLTIEIYDSESLPSRRIHDRVVDQVDERCGTIERFLQSFDSLTRLSIAGFRPSMASIGIHRSLKYLRLHNFEPTSEEEKPRPVLSVDDVAELNGYCPLLEYLEIDVYRDGHWTEAVPKMIAGSFRNLRCLVLHLEVGIYRRPHSGPRPIVERRWRYPTVPAIEPQLTYESVCEFSQAFFSWRCPGTRLRRLILKAGELLRRWPLEEPSYTKVERARAVTFEVLCSLGDGTILDIEKIAPSK